MSLCFFSLAVVRSLPPSHYVAFSVLTWRTIAMTSQPLQCWLLLTAVLCTWCGYGVWEKTTTTVPYLYVFIRNACSGYIQGDECCADWLNEMSHKKTIARHRCKIYSASEIQVFTAGQINGRHLSLLPSSSTHSLHRKQTHTRTRARTRTHTHT